MNIKMNSKIVSFMLCFMCIVFIFPLYANAQNLDNREIAQKNINNYLLKDKEQVISDLNKVSNSNIVSTKQYKESNGNTIKVETRILKNADGIEIRNIREYIYSPMSTTQTINDRYGLFWGGVSGGDGYLVATYKYTHPHYDNPNRCTTQFFLAQGTLDNSSYHELVDTDPNWDTVADYEVDASVQFDIQQKPTYLYPVVSYTNTCHFDSYGMASFSWF